MGCIVMSDSLLLGSILPLTPFPSVLVALTTFSLHPKLEVLFLMNWNVCHFVIMELEPVVLVGSENITFCCGSVCINSLCRFGQLNQFCKRVLL